MYMISQKNYNHLFATKHMWKAEKIKEITYPRKGTCVCKHLFITYPAVYSQNIKNRICSVKYLIWQRNRSKNGVPSFDYLRLVADINQLLQLCTARTAWSESDQAVRAVHSCNSWWLSPLWSDWVIKLVSVLFGKCTTLVATKCWPMETRLSLGDQWKAEKLGVFRRWPITRCFIKSDRAGLFIEHSINFPHNGEHWRAVQYCLSCFPIVCSSANELYIF